MDSDFRFVAYRKDTGDYAHFGSSVSLALIRATTDLKQPSASFVVVDLGDKGWPFVQSPHKLKFDDAMKIGKLADELPF